MARARTFGLTILGLVLFAGLGPVVEAQTNVSGRTPIPVGAGLPGISFTGKNATKTNFDDFTLELDPNCGVNLKSVAVDPNFGDWDVDDDRDGTSNEDTERDNNVNPSGKLARVDNDFQGTGAGRPIPPGSEFGIVVTFDPNTPAGCTLFLTPTDDKDFGLASINLQKGNNAYVQNNSDSIFAGLAVASPNVTGDVVGRLTLTTTGDYHLDQVLEINSLNGAEVQTKSCGGATSCSITLAIPVGSLETVRFDAVYDHLAPGASTTLTVQAFSPSSRPALPLWAVACLAVMMLVAARLLARQRRPAV